MMMALDPELAVSEGSPALAYLILALGGAAISRTFAGRAMLTRMMRRERPEP